MLSKDSLNLAVKAIIEHQISVIGPMALEQANKVSGLKVTDGNDDVKVNVSGKDATKLLTELVSNYEKLFGRASIEVCRDAVREIQPPLPKGDLPQILQ